MKTIIYKMNDASPELVHAIVEEDGVRTAKAIPWDVFVDIVTTTSAEQEKISYIGKLPTGFVDGGYSRDGKSMEAIVRLPGDVRTFLHNNEPYEIPFPNLIFMLKVSGGNVVRSFVCVEIKGKYYHYPFANVYPDGHICFGTLTFRDLSNLKDMERVIAAFIGANSNNDLYKPVQVKTKEGTMDMDQKQLLHFLKGKKDWPKEIKLKQFRDIDIPFKI